MSNWEKYLKDIYLDPSHPASFGSPDRLYKIVKKEGKHKISHLQIKRWIQKQESYSLNKGVTRKPVGFMQSCCFVFVGIFFCL